MDRTIHSHNFYLAMILQRHCLAVRLNGAKDNTIWSWINIAVMLLDRLKMWHPYYAYLTFISAIFLPISLYKWTASWHLLCSSFELWYVSEVKISLHGTMRNQTSFAPNGKHIYNELFPIPYVVRHTEKSNSVNKWLISATTSMSVYSLGGGTLQIREHLIGQRLKRSPEWCHQNHWSTLVEVRDYNIGMLISDTFHIQCCWKVCEPFRIDFRNQISTQVLKIDKENPIRQMRQTYFLCHLFIYSHICEWQKFVNLLD